MDDALRELLDAISQVEEVLPEQRLGAIRELLRAETRGPATAAFGAETMAWFVKRGTISPEPAPEGPAPRPAEELALPHHLDLVGRLQAGGMGEVWEVRDRVNGVPRALKTLRPEYAANPLFRALFKLEIKTTDRLQHPGIPPVSDYGDLPDGRPYYAMRIYRGRTLEDDLGAQRGRPRSYAVLRPLVARLLAVSEIVGYAHTRGYVHRDLKPANVFLGERELVVLDWGIALRVVPGDTARSDGAGTRAYMSPEAIAEQPLGFPTDVWSLGVLLRDVRSAGVALPEGDPPEIRGLDPLIAAATAQNPADRPADANELAALLRRWLERGDQRQGAMELVQQADEEARSAARLSAQAAAARQQAEVLGAGLQPWQPAEDKQLAWLAEDEAVALERRAARHLVERERLLNTTFTIAPELPEAHERLAAIHRAHHERAELQGDVAAAERAEALLRAHDRGGHADYLRGDGAVTVVTEPAGAQATLFRYVLRHRRLVPEYVRELGPTPIVAATVPHGSWVVRLSLPGHRTVDHPVHVARLEHVDGVAPGEHAPRPIRLPREGALDADDCVITPGWTFTGWDREAPSAAPDGRVWIEGFVMKRFPTTNREYLTFLNGLRAEGREEEALRWAPRAKGSAAEPRGRLLYGLGPDGFFLTRDAEGSQWEPDVPVLMIDWASAAAYAAWWAARADLPWRLPGEDEWARAARGADKRVYPWGWFFDPSWALMRSSRARPEEVLPGSVHGFPGDEGPFGVRTLAGGTRQWCRNVWGDGAPERREQPALRGGAFSGGSVLSRIETRTFAHPLERSVIFGFRMVRST